MSSRTNTIFIVGVMVMLVVVTTKAATIDRKLTRSISSSHQVNLQSNLIPKIRNTTLKNSIKLERTLILVKPDAVQRGLIGKIIDRFETKGFKLIGLKIVWATEELIHQHYGQLANRKFYSALIESMIDEPVVPMVCEGVNAVSLGRQMVGTAEPGVSQLGTIRGDFSIDVGRNVIHGSHSVEAAEKEIHLWFNKNEIISWTPVNIRFMYTYL